jgi:hypothetical protein
MGLLYLYITSIRYFIYLSSWMTNDVRRTRGSKFSEAVAKAAFSKKKKYSPANWISI